MDERSLLTLLQKRPNEGMKELMRQYMGQQISRFNDINITEC